MKVVLLSTYKVRGGAAIACYRLYKSLSMQTAISVSTSLMDHTGPFSKFKALFRLALEKVYFQLYQASPSVRFQFSLANTGEDISTRKEIKEAELIHLHWVNHGFLSLNGIEQLSMLEKPMVWTLHDMWAFTGGCHYSGACDHYTHQCGNCFFLKRPAAHDLSFDIHQKKSRNKAYHRITIVACSHWLAECARQSSLFKDQDISVIPNPIDTMLYQPLDKAALRKRYNISADVKILLFAAAGVHDKRKGFIYLTSALQELSDLMSKNTDKIELIILGDMAKGKLPLLPFKTHSAGYIHDEQQMAEYYAMADVFVSPSLEDNLPNTIMESMSCGTPVVAFNIGGISDLIEHLHNGYIVRSISAEELTKGIHYLLNLPKLADTYGKAARSKVLKTFDSKIVAEQYKNLYRKLLLNTQQ